MFEKEAEEYVDLSGNRNYTERAFKDGAEFGYNKATEWHYVKDGDLPKIGKPCLVYLANDNVITAKLREDNVWTTDGRNAFENVIAWFEIPKFEEE